MTPNQVVAVAFRLFAVWLGLQTLRTVPSFFIVSDAKSPGYAYSLFLFALTVVVSLGFWFFPRAIAGKVLPPHNAEPPPAATTDDWLSLGCCLIGLWSLTAVIPRLFFAFFALTSLSSYADRSQLQGTVLYNLVELAVALWLILGGRGITKLFRWAQNAGTRKDL